MLIDEWGESNKSLFDENHFPKVYPIKDSVSMNVVWTKNERQQLQTLKNSLNEEDLTELVTHIADFKDLSSRNKGTGGRERPPETGSGEIKVGTNRKSWFGRKRNV